MYDVEINSYVKISDKLLLKVRTKVREIFIIRKVKVQITMRCSGSEPKAQLLNNGMSRDVLHVSRLCRTRCYGVICVVRITVSNYCSKVRQQVASLSQRRPPPPLPPPSTPSSLSRMGRYCSGKEGGNLREVFIHFKSFPVATQFALDKLSKPRGDKAQLRP